MRHSLGVPYPGYLAVLVRRTAVLWLLVRLFTFAFLLLVVREDFATAGRQPSFGFPAVLVWVDRKLSHEQLLHANLGASEFWFWAVALAAALGLDLLAALILALI